VLISAYDIHHGIISTTHMAFPEFIILDSGGYEASVDHDMSDLQKKVHVPIDGWNVKMHQKVLDDWAFKTPTIVVSYDNPKLRKPLDEQVARAHRLFKQYPRAIKCFLIKPEPGSKGRAKPKYIDFKKILVNVELLEGFDVIGLTEKELGASTFDRMKNIAHLRKALTAANNDTPIHIFGSLDPISSPLYFLSGADIFDGLTWLRFAYSKGVAIYKHNYGALEVNIEMNDDVVNAQVWYRNYNALIEMQCQMRQFLHTKNFSAFKENEGFLRNASERLLEAVGGE